MTKKQSLSINHQRTFEYYTEAISLMPIQLLLNNTLKRSKSWHFYIFKLTFLLVWFPTNTFSQTVNTNCTLSCPSSRLEACRPLGSLKSVSLGVSDREVCHRYKDCYGGLSEQIVPVQQKPVYILHGQSLSLRLDQTVASSSTLYWQLYNVTSTEFIACDISSYRNKLVRNLTQKSSFVFNSTQFGIGTFFFVGEANNILTCSLGLRITIKVKPINCLTSGNSVCNTKGICIANSNDTVASCSCCPGYNGTGCGEYDACISNPCLNSGNCTDVIAGFQQNYTCSCTPYFTGKRCETRVDYCDPLPCLNNATCNNLVLQGNYSCNCQPGFSGRNCEVNINECLDNNCTRNATCIDLINGFRCDCNGNWTGEYCEIDINECASIVCQNNGTCINTPGSFHCICPVNVTGQFCETDLFNNCLSNPCLYNGVCTDLVGGYKCTCPQGYTGIRCETDVNECQSNPCAAEGTSRCINSIGNYSCVCRSEYTGRNCEQLINRCVPSPCLHGGLCVNVFGDYSCVCPAGYQGKNCQEVLNKCHYKPCRNNATCEQTGDFLRNYTCHCLPGWTGRNCTQDYNECASNPCLNGGSCLDMFNRYECVCNIGWYGTRCELNYDACKALPCKNNATCLDLQTRLDYTCTCTPGFTGQNCSVNIDDCVRLRANCNNGRCIDQVGSYYCNCSNGWYGKYCDTNRDMCASRPCLNAAVCENMNTTLGYKCQCQTGWTGVNCDTNINDCASNPCKNGGSCNDYLNYYNCSCRPGYVGKHCENETNECLSQPCLNNATCVNAVGRFACTCLPGYTGLRCETNINECASDPCFNNATCIDQTNAYTCNCKGGYLGSHCEIPRCRTNPCRNGAACVQMQDRYVCQCLAGYTGQNCETQINECASNPCRNNGTCVDQLNGYQCNCFNGYSGRICETHLCETNVCRNGGVCQRTPSGYSCTCLNGFTGQNCEQNINECLSNPCNINGTLNCTDLVGGYRCFCRAGFVGSLCENHTCYVLAPCRNGAPCVQSPDGFRCMCRPGFTGKNCELNINECASNPCINGVCHDRINGFTCNCSAMFTGVRCETNMDSCISGPCVNNGTCVNNITSLSYSCTCLGGYTGNQCESHICDMTTPCLNNATCLRMPHNYSCQCSAGFTGNRCEIDINECSSTPCLNMGSCVNKRGSFACICPRNFTGPRCESLVDYCSPNPCNNGSCVNNFLAQTYNCSCPPAFSGRQCEYHICDLRNPCKNGATCIKAFERPICNCLPGFTGQNCSININECASSPCLNNGTCTDLLNRFSCNCNARYTGVRCEANADYCAANPCRNSGLCQNDFLNASYKCVCTPYATGRNCEIYLGPCFVNQCLNNGTCRELNGTNFKCACPFGFNGTICECATCPCQNNGRCGNFDGIVKCICPNDYGGPLCESYYGDCRNNASRKCLSDSFCVQSPYGYVCQCPGHLSGDTRCNKVSTCNPSPCQNGATCSSSGFTSLKCNCQQGFTGQFCQFDINECASSPCLNGGQCREVGAGNLTCICQGLFYGNFCQYESAVSSNLQISTQGYFSQILTTFSIQSTSTQNIIYSTTTTSSVFRPSRTADITGSRYSPYFTGSSTISPPEVSSATFTTGPTPLSSSIWSSWASSSKRFSTATIILTSQYSYSSPSSQSNMLSSLQIYSTSMASSRSSPLLSTNNIISAPTSTSLSLLPTNSLQSSGILPPSVSFPDTGRSYTTSFKPTTGILSEVSNNPFQTSSTPTSQLPTSRLHSTSISSAASSQIAIATSSTVSPFSEYRTLERTYRDSASLQFSKESYLASLTFTYSQNSFPVSSVMSSRVQTSSVYESIGPSQLASSIQTASQGLTRTRSPFPRSSLESPFPHGSSMVSSNPSALTPSMLETLTPFTSIRLPSSIFTSTILKNFSSRVSRESYSSIQMLSTFKYSLDSVSSQEFITTPFSHVIVQSSDFLTSQVVSPTRSLAQSLESSVTNPGNLSLTTENLSPSYGNLSSTYGGLTQTFTLESFTTGPESSNFLSRSSPGRLGSTPGSLESRYVFTSKLETGIATFSSVFATQISNLPTSSRTSSNTSTSSLRPSYSPLSTRNVEPISSLSSSVDISSVSNSSSYRLSFSTPSNVNQISTRTQAETLQYSTQRIIPSTGQSSFLMSSSAYIANICSSSPCLRGGNCMQISSQNFNCSCPIGYGGRRCESLTCQCQNGGRCVRDSTSSSFSCVCKIGFSGRLCKARVPDCRTENCSGHGVCRERLQGFSCNCNAGYYGDRCQNYSSNCVPNPCQNSGICFTRSNNTGGGFACVCSQGYQGPQCQFDYNECAISPCRNGGTCREESINSYTCYCPSWSYGTNCELLRSTEAAATSYGMTTAMKSAVSQDISFSFQPLSTVSSLISSRLLTTPGRSQVLPITTLSPFFSPWSSRSMLISMSSTLKYLTLESVTTYIPDSMSSEPAKSPAQSQSYISSLYTSGSITRTFSFIGIDSSRLLRSTEIQGSSVISADTITSKQTLVPSLAPSRNFSMTESRSTFIHANVSSNFPTVYGSTATSLQSESTTRSLPISEIISTPLITATSSFVASQSVLGTSSTTQLDSSVLSNNTGISASVIQQSSSAPPISSVGKISKLSTAAITPMRSRTLESSLLSSSIHIVSSSFQGESITVTSSDILPSSAYTTMATASSIIPTVPPFRNVTCADSPCNGYRCFNESNNGLQYRCECLYPSFGPRCLQGLTIHFPYFNGHSYVEYAPIPFTEVINTIVMTFRTTKSKGMLLYAGHKTYRDFIMLSVVDGLVEFRFDAGSGAVAIRSLERVDSGSLMTVVATHDSRTGTGTLAVNSSSPVSQRSSSSFKSIQLSTPWYIGGFNNTFRPINSSNALPNIGSLTGCVRDLQVNNKPYRVINARRWLSIAECDIPACQRGPCRNNATCVQNQDNLQLYTCICGTGYYGTDCSERRAHCQGDPCNGGTCVWTPTGHICLCQFGRHGASCLSSINITNPVFSHVYNYSSYIEYPWQQTVRNTDERFEIRMQFKFNSNDPNSFRNGILAFAAQSTIGAASDDFFAVGIINNYTYLLYNLGGGVASVRSLQPVDHSRTWHFIVAGRVGRSGYMYTDSQSAVHVISPGVLTGLDVYTPLYIGGVPDFSKLPSIVRAYFQTGFIGTIFDASFRTNALSFKRLLTQPAGSLAASVNGVTVERGLNIGDGAVNECVPNPCQNNGTCSQSGGQFICTCPAGWSGITCKDRRILCIDYNPCAAGSICQTNSIGISCDCQLGRIGVHCDQAVNITQPYFKVNSFMGFRRPDVKYFTKVFIRFKAAKLNGLLFYLSEDIESTNGDYFAISLWNGYVYVRFNLGLGMTTMRSRKIIQIGQWHQLYVERRSKEAIMRLDNNMYIGVRGSGSYTQLNVGSIVYLGGIPRLSTMNSAAVKDVNSQRDFQGTVSHFIVNDVVQILNSTKAVVGRNIEDAKRTCILNQCKNGASCSTVKVSKTYPYTCSCTLGWQGDLCDTAIPRYTKAKFAGDGYIFYQDNITTPSTENHIEFTINTTSDGLIMWLGELRSNKSDYLAVGIQNNKLKLSIDTGGGLFQFEDKLNITDGKAHKIIITRVSFGSFASIAIILNGFQPVLRNMMSTDQALDSSGHIYIGGLDGDVNLLSKGQYKSGLNGCIWDVKLPNSLDLNKNLYNRGKNVRSCG